MKTCSNTIAFTTAVILGAMTGATACAAPTTTASQELPVTGGAPAKEETPAKAETSAKPENPANAEPGVAPSAGYLESIARLNALRIFEASPLQDRIGETSNCYVSSTAIGVVCAGDEGKYATEIAAAEKKLADFAALAEKVAATVTSGSAFGPGTDLEAIKALHIFQVGEFIVDQPESRSCYGFCNPSNQTRESQLQAIKEAL